MHTQSRKSDETSQKLASFDYNINGQLIYTKTLLNPFQVTACCIQILQSKIKDGQVASKIKESCILIDFVIGNTIREHIKSLLVSSKQCLVQIYH